MNKNIDKFDNFLLERSRAEKELKRAEKKLRKAKEHSEEGKDERAEREIEKAKELLAKAKELDPKIDIAEVESDIADVEEVDWKEEFDITTSFLGKRVKSDDFDYIKKIKIVGNEISPEEVILFLKSVRTYINQNWDDIKDGDGKEEYRSTHNDKMVIDVNNKSKKITFTYKEKGGIFVDKAKLEIDKEVFEDKENRDKMSDELDKLIGTKHFAGEEGKVSQKYDKKKDKEKIATITTVDIIDDKVRNVADDPEVTKVVTKELKELKTPDNNFIKDSVNLLINENLNLGGLTDLANTDEQKIFDWFVTNNAKKTINPKNVDSILTGYKKRKSMMSENIFSDTWDATKRGFQSVVGTESKGVVQDLMNAFNTDSKTVQRDMNNMLAKLADAYGEMLTKEIEKASVKIQADVKDNPEKYDNIKESIVNEGLSQWLGGAMLSKMLLRGGIGAGATAVAGGATATGATATTATGTFLGMGPVGWIILGVVAVTALGFWLYNTFDEQQFQIAHIFLLMWASQSPKFLQEMKRVGIQLNENIKPNVDEDKLRSILSEPIAEVETETEANEGRKYVKTFESMYPVDKDTKTAYNTAMFNMSVTDEEENIVFNENVESDKIKELKKDFKEKGYKIAIKKAKDEKDEK